MKDQHMRASSPFYSKPPGTPLPEDKQVPDLRPEVVQRLSLALHEALKKENEKEAFTSHEAVEALYATLATTAAMCRQPSISKLTFVAEMAKTMVRFASNIFDVAVKQEARTGVAG